MSEIKKILIQETEHSFGPTLKTINDESLHGEGNISFGRGVQKIIFEGSILASINGSENIISLPEGWQNYYSFVIVIENNGSTPISVSLILPRTMEMNYSFVRQTTSSCLIMGDADWTNGEISLRCGRENQDWDNYSSSYDDRYYVKLIVGI